MRLRLRFLFRDRLRLRLRYCQRRLLYAAFAAQQRPAEIQTPDEITREAMAQARRQSKGDQTKAAWQPGVSRAALWRY